MLELVHLLGDAASITLVVFAVLYWKREFKPLIRGLRKAMEQNK